VEGDDLVIMEVAEVVEGDDLATVGWEEAVVVVEGDD
jgi:hypothetical protein